MKLNKFHHPSIAKKAAGKLLGSSPKGGQKAEGSKKKDLSEIMSDVSKTVQTVGSIVQTLAPIAAALLPLLTAAGSSQGMLPAPDKASGKGQPGSRPVGGKKPFGGGLGGWRPGVSPGKQPFLPPSHFRPSRMQGPDMTEKGRLRFEESGFDQGKELAQIGSLVDLMKMSPPEQVRAAGMDPERIGEVEKAVKQGVCQTLSLKWLKRQLKHDGKDLNPDDNMSRLRKSMLKVTDLQSRIPQVSPNPMKSAEDKFGLDPDRALINFGNVSNEHFSKAITDSKDGDFLYRFNFPKGHRYEGSSHAIGFSTEGKFVKAFEPNKGEFKIPKSEFGQWFGELRDKYGLDSSQFGDELIPYTLRNN